MEENRMTIEQVLDVTVKLLNSIQVPVSLMESIGKPISQAVSNLGLCIAAIKQAEVEAKKEEQEDGTDPDPE